MEVSSQTEKFHSQRQADAQNWNAQLQENSPELVEPIKSDSVSPKEPSIISRALQKKFGILARFVAKRTSENSVQTDQVPRKIQPSLPTKDEYVSSLAEQIPNTQLKETDIVVASSTFARDVRTILQDERIPFVNIEEKVTTLLPQINTLLTSSDPEVLHYGLQILTDLEFTASARKDYHFKQLASRIFMQNRDVLARQKTALLSSGVTEINARTIYQIAEMSEHLLDRVGELADTLKTKGIETKRLIIPSIREPLEALVLAKSEKREGEKTVRIYRGVSQTADVLSQTAYATRIDTQHARGEALVNTIEKEVQTLADNPTYEHLIEYASRIKPELNENQAKELETSIRTLEDDILQGIPLRSALLQEQIKHGGAISDSGISPYLSASWSPLEASGYTRGGFILVIDIPPSHLDLLAPNSTEVAIKSRLDPRYITGIISLQNRDTRDTNALPNCIDAITRSTPNMQLSPSEDNEFRNDYFTTRNETDQEQLPTDMKQVRETRTKNLIQAFPELQLDRDVLSNVADELNSNTYNVAKELIFDHYADIFSQQRGRRADIEGYSFQSDLRFGERVTFDRSSITDEMLVKLREFIAYQRQRSLQAA